MFDRPINYFHNSPLALKVSKIFATIKYLLELEDDLGFVARQFLTIYRLSLLFYLIDLYHFKEHKLRFTGDSYEIVNDMPKSIHVLDILKSSKIDSIDFSEEKGFSLSFNALFLCVGNENEYQLTASEIKTIKLVLEELYQLLITGEQTKLHLDWVEELDLIDNNGIISFPYVQYLDRRNVRS